VRALEAFPLHISAYDAAGDCASEASLFCFAKAGGGEAK
jgi:hypothetical protein